jgi:hypothetical protein
MQSISLPKTFEQYQQEAEKCREVFQIKLRTYGASWRLFRPISLTDQLFIKALRIRTIQETNAQLIDEGILEEFKAIFNYSIITMIQVVYGSAITAKHEESQIMKHYDDAAMECYELMKKKNHDYGEAWRHMMQESFCDMILVKLARIKQLLTGSLATKQGEVKDNLIDLVNYSAFALIQITEQKIIQ